MNSNRRHDDMRSSKFFVVYALFALAGCGGGTPSATALSPAGLQGDGGVSAATFGEVFKSKSIVVKQQSCISGQSGVATFKVKGNAGGPFRGTFTASGQWSFAIVGGQSIWTFAETFKIAGGHPADGTITGNGMGTTAKCKTFGPVSALTDLQYKLGMASGAATTNLMKNRGSLLQRLH
jgi:hypothetical protein